MQYVLSFLEGVITFVSPCVLPMLPIYVSYFMGRGGEGDSKNAAKNAAAFVLGFTVVFLVFGLFAGVLGSFLHRWQTALNIATGGVLMLFGLQYIGLLQLPFISTGFSKGPLRPLSGTFSFFLFGLVFAVCWSPCVGVFLGAALALAAGSGSALQGAAMLLCYAAGLGLPFLLSAVLLGQLQGVFGFIKKHSRALQIFAGWLLVVAGALMATGYFGRLLALFTVV